MTSTSKHALTTELDIEKAIDAEADAWAKFFEVIGRDDEAEQIEGRKAVMRANVAVGYIDPLLPFLADRETGLTPRQLAERLAFWLDFAKANIGRMDADELAAFEADRAALAKAEATTLARCTSQVEEG